jgi:uncharacterized repeat protein (TIGR01451 family)
MRARLASVVISLLVLAPAAVSGQANNHDLQIVLEANPTAVLTGNQVTVTMRCRNNGPNPSTAANVTSATPAGTTLTSVSTSKGEVTQQPAPGGGGAIRVELGGLAVNEAQTVTLVLAVTAAPGSLVTAMGEIQPFNPMGDGVQSNNRASVQIQVVAPTTADIGVAIGRSAGTAGTDSLYNYTIAVSNLPTSTGAERRDAATNVEVGGMIPDGAVFADVDVTQGEASVPGIGEPGSFVCRLGALEEGHTTSVELTIRVVADPGHTLVLTVIASSAAADPAPDNNTAAVSTPVVASGTATVSWEAPEAPSDANPLPPPQRLVVASSGAPGAYWPARGSALMAYNVYRSNKPGVQPTAGNFFTSVPPDQTSTAAPVAPGGSFFTVTAVYDEGESAPSNEGSAEVPAATLSRVKVKAAKITATGAGFSDSVTVFVDGIPFVIPAAVKKNNTKVVQRGGLLVGVTLGQYLATHPAVLITFRNSNGGVTAYRHPQ